MRVPRVHRFRTGEEPARLFEKLTPGGRFRFAAGARCHTVFGHEPVAAVAGTRHDPVPLDRVRALLPRVPRSRRDETFPGGAVGFLTYEAGHALEGLPPREEDPAGPPDLFFGVYDTFATWRDGDVCVVSWGLTPSGGLDGGLAWQRARALEETLRGPAPAVPGRPPPSEIRAGLTRAEHGERVRSILESISRGDIYQANLTVRFEAALEGDGVALFDELLRENPAPYSAFLEADGTTVISCSPERMLRVQGRELECCPIKGTASRDPEPRLDAARADALRASEKDAAELLMITDLVRNDLGKVAEWGTVRVPALRELRSFPHVHHLVSRVTARLDHGRDALDALRAVFPFGSITGAPKRRAMQLLAELEPVPRGVYTGTVGWLGFDGTADFSVAIRTGHLSGGVFSFGAGGGIVADSREDAEWEELLVKALGIRLALGAKSGSRVAGAR